MNQLMDSSQTIVSRTSMRSEAPQLPVRGLTKLLAELDTLAEQGPLPLLKLQRLFSALELRAGDLAAFQLFSPKCYQRNRIRRTRHYEMLLICWAPGQGSPVHDHTGSACAFKVVDGSCCEQRYERVEDGAGEPLRAVKQGDPEVFPRGSVCVSEDSDIHRVGNPSDQQNLCTLHLYSPPLDAMRQYEALEVAPAFA